MRFRAMRFRGVRAALALGVAVAALAAVLVGCGGSPSSSSSSAQDGTGSMSPSGSGASAFPVSIAHVYGSTNIPKPPTRVLTLGLSDQDAVLALGVKPIAVSPWYGDYQYATWPWAQDELGDAKPVVLNNGVRNEAEPRLEEIASLRPDLILSLYNGTTQKQYQQLSAIAPTVLPTKQFANFQITWQEATRVTGKALGESARAESIVSRLDKRVAAAAAAHPEFKGKRLIIGERFETGKTVVRGASNDPRALFFTKLGFILPTRLGNNALKDEGVIEVSDELIGLLSQDVLVWNVGFAEDARKQIESNPLYATLPVVRAGHVLWLEDPVVSGAFSWGTALSLDYALDKLVPQIRTVVD